MCVCVLITNSSSLSSTQPHASPIKVKNCFTVNPSTGVLRLSCAKPFVAGHSQFRFGLVFSDGERRDIVSLIVTSHQHYPPVSIQYHIYIVYEFDMLRLQLDYK